MPIVAFRCGHVVPLWAVAFCAVALSAPQRVRPLLTTLLAVGVIAYALPAIVRRFGPARRRVEVLPPWDDVSPAAELVIATGTRMRTLDEAIAARVMKPDDAADLVRMDDDGGQHMTGQSALADGSVPVNQRRR